MGKMPPSFTQRQVTVAGSMLPGSAGGRTSLVSPEPRPLPVLGIDNDGGELVATFGTKGLWTDLPDSSGPFPARNSGIIFEVTFSCNVAASDDTVIEIFKNGVSLGEWTLPAGEGDGPAYTAAFDGGAVAVNDVMRIDHVSGGTGLEDPTILIAAFSDTGSRGSPGQDGADGVDGDMASIVEGPGIGVDDTDPANPIVSRKFVGCRVYKPDATPQSIPDATPTALLYPNEDFDALGMHSTSSNTSRITPGITGYWDLDCGAEFSGMDSSSQLGVYFRKNGTTDVTSGGGGWVTAIPYTGYLSARTSVRCYLLDTDYIEVVVYQWDTAAAINFDKGEFGASLIGV